MKTKIIFSLFAVLFFVGALFAQDDSADKKTSKSSKYKLDQDFRIDFAYYFGNHRGYKTTGFAPVNYNRMDWKYLAQRNPAIGASAGGTRNDIGNAFAVEFKANYTLTMMFPVMRKDSMFMKDNSIKLKIHANLSPVSIEAGPTLEIHPLAFLFFGVTQLLGTGWDLGFMNINGVAINDPNFKYTDEREYFKRSKGLMAISKMFACLQFDTGAIWKGDWTHVVLRIYEEIVYQNFTGAKNNQYWRWEHDLGENQNGFVWFQYFTIGYMMPTTPGYLKLVGVRIETEQRITGKDKSKVEDWGWGSDFINCTFGPMFVFEFKGVTKDDFIHNLIFLMEFKTERQYTDQTVLYRDFRQRVINRSSPSYVYFYRFAIVYNMRF